MYGMEEQRDYAEEDYNRHTMHTGDGELNYCERPECVHYVPKRQRDPERVKQDLAFYKENGEI